MSFLILFISIVVAVYEDEAFKVDWQINTLGSEIEHSVLLGSNYIALSNNGILSNVNNTLKGTLSWRKQLEMGNNSKKFLAVLSDVILTGMNFQDSTGFSESSKIQLWRLQDSYLIKEFILDNCIHSTKTLNNREVLIIDDEFKLSILDIETLEISSAKIDLVDLNPFAPRSIDVSLLSNGNYFILLNENVIILYSGNTHSILFLEKDLKLEIEKVVKIFSNKIIYINKRGLIDFFVINNLNKLSTDKSAFKIIRTDYDEKDLSLIDLNSYVPINNFDFYGSSIKNRSLIKYIEILDENLVAALGADTIQIFDSELGIEQILFTHGAKINFDQVSKILIDYKDKNQLHVIFEFYNGEISSIYNCEILWKKDNSLSDLLKIVVYDPSKDISTQITENEELGYYIHEECDSNLFGSFLSRWIYHIKILKSFKIKNLTSFFINLLESLIKPAVLEENSKLEFGLKKQLIVLTSNYKIFSINSENGEILWRTCEFDKYTSEPKITSIYNNNNKNINVVFANGDYISLNPINGEVINYISDFTGKNQKIIDINLNELTFAIYGNHNHTFLLDNDILTVDIDDENKFNYIPAGNDTPEFLNQDFFMVTSHDDDKMVQGIKFNPFAKTVETTWKYTVSSDEKIIAICSIKSQLDSMASAGIVLGDRKTLYKYVNPNFIAVAIFNYKTKSLLILIIDSVSGQAINTILHSQKEDISIGPNASEDFQMVFEENYLIYSFHSYSPSVSTKIHVVEMYQSLKPDEKTLDNFKSSLIKDLPKPYFESKSYNFPERISKMALTNTKFNIAIKHLVLKLRNGQIIMLPKFLVSARRVTGRELTPEEKQEFMAIPYSPNLGIDPNYVISHKRFILGNTNNEYLFSEPTGLESTSMVCYFSTDLFCTKVYPSLKFDTLSTSFNKDILLATILGLCMIYLYVKSLVEKKRLNSFWVDNT